MTSQPPRYILANPPVRQNAHINSELIKNNSQASLPHRGPTISPQPTYIPIGGAARPIEMRGNSPSHPVGGQILHLTNQMPVSHGPGLGNKIISAHNTARTQNIKNNSNSRLFTQHEQVQYLNVTGEGDSKANWYPAPQTTRHSPVITNVQIQGRPVSNVSNNSSLSRNSADSRPSSKVRFTINQSKSLEHRNVFMPITTPIPDPNTNYKTISPSRLAPSQPPSAIVTYANIQQHDPQTIQAQPQSQPQLQPQPIVMPRIETDRRNTQSNNMHTSDVKIVYQRGSFSPNDGNSNKLSRQETLSPRQQIVQSVPQTGSNNNQPTITTYEPRKNNKVPIADLKQKRSNEPEVVPYQRAQNTSPVAINRVNMTAVESFVQNNNGKTSSELFQQHFQGNSNYNAYSNAHVNVKESLHKQQIIKQAEPRKIIEISEQPKKVYKSYEQYLQETRKPEKVIQQIQQSQLGTQINIEYRKAQPVPAPLSARQNQQIVQKRQSVYESIPIPTMYGNVDLRNQQNSQASSQGALNSDAVFGSHNYYPPPNTNTYKLTPNQLTPPIGPPQQDPQHNISRSGNISTIREQTREYDHQGEYEYSSSLIGSSLQDNLRLASANKELSDYQPASWSKARPGETDRLDGLPFNKPISISSQPLFHDENGQIKEGFKINPFAMIENTDNKRPLPSEPITYTQSNHWVQPMPIPTQAPMQLQIPPNMPTPTTPLATSKPIERPQEPLWRGEGVNYNKNKWQINEQSQKYNISTKDRISSQKIIQTTHRITHAHHAEHSGSEQAITSRQKINYNNNRQQIDNQEEENSVRDASFDVYELIDTVYNRELQVGLLKIRQVFGTVIAGIGAGKYQQ